MGPQKWGPRMQGRGILVWDNNIKGTGLYWRPQDYKQLTKQNKTKQPKHTTYVEQYSKFRIREP